MSLYVYFIALVYMPLVDVVTLYNTTPLFVPLLAGWVLGERLTGKNWFGILIAFIGVIVLIGPTSDIFSIYSLLALLSGLLMSVGEVCNRKLSETDTVNTIVFWFILLSFFWCFLPIAWLLLSHDFHMPVSMTGNYDSNHWSNLFLLLGLVSWGYQMFRTKSLSLAPVSKVMPFSYFSIVVAALLGSLIWQQTPSMMSVLGIVLIVAGTLMVSTGKNTGSAT